MNISLSCCSTNCRGKERQPLDARISQKKIGSVYDAIAPIYDIWGKLTESRARRRAIELAAINDGESILEVAVGTGLAFSEILQRNPHGTNIGIDLSLGMLERAKRRAEKHPESNYTLKYGTAFDLPIADGSVDTLVNNYMFDLIPFKDMDVILQEFHRVMKKDGKLILVNMTQGESFSSRLYDFIYHLSPKTMGGCRGVVLKEKLQQNRFTVESREYFQQMLFPSEVILAHKTSVHHEG